MAEAAFAKFGTPFKMSGKEIAQRGRSFWGPGIEDGDLVDLTKATQNATDRFLATLEAHPHAKVIVPVQEFIDPNIVKAGVLYDLDLVETEKKIQKAKMDLLTEVDNICAPDNDIRKATTTASNLMHTMADQQVTVLFKKILPVQTLFNTVACKGKYAQWDAVTPNGGGSAYFDGEDPELVESDISDITKMTAVKIMYSKGRLTKMAMLAGEAQTPARDLMAIRTMASNEMIKQLRERSFIGVNRDLANTANAFAPANISIQYAGLYELITGHTAATGTRTHASPNWVAATAWGGETDPATAWRKFVEQDLNETYRRMVYYGQVPDIMLTDYRTFSFIRTALNDMFRGVDNMVTTTFGISKLNLAMPNGIIPLVPVPFMPNTVGNGNIFMLNTDTIERRILWPETFEELANVNTSKQYVISAAECLIDKTDYNADTTTCLSMQGGVWAIPTLV